MPGSLPLREGANPAFPHRSSALWSLLAAGALVAAAGLALTMRRARR
jgi:hypothetical protein